jgi:hypothetical protein
MRVPGRGGDGAVARISRVCGHPNDLEEFVSESKTVFELVTPPTPASGVWVAVAGIGAGNPNAGIETALAVASAPPAAASETETK